MREENGKVTFGFVLICVVLVLVVTIGVFVFGAKFALKYSDNADKNDNNGKEVVNVSENETVNNSVSNENVVKTENSIKNETVKNESKVETVENKVTEKVTEKVAESDSGFGKKKENVSSSKNLEGEYKIELFGEDGIGYHCSIVNVSNATDESIEFSINTSHGLSVENVNIGEVSGTAKKDSSGAYVFEETLYDFNSKITLKFEDNKLRVDEEYSNGMNPYAGHNVYFEGDYEKVK